MASKLSGCIVKRRVSDKENSEQPIAGKLKNGKKVRIDENKDEKE
jgi:hypothetical protein